MTDAVTPIPPHYAGATPYAVVPDVAASLAWYKHAFGAIELYRLTGPDGVVVHAEQRIGAATVMLGCPAPPMNARPATDFGGTPVAIVVYVDDVDTFIATAAAAGGTLSRPPADQFYGDRVASLTDPFGLRWMFATHIEDVTPAEMQTRLNTLFATPDPG